MLYSAAIRGGLIEANVLSSVSLVGQQRIPPRFAAASLKLLIEARLGSAQRVFRRDSRRPH